MINVGSENEIIYLTAFLDILYRIPVLIFFYTVLIGSLCLVNEIILQISNSFIQPTRDSVSSVWFSYYFIVIGI